MLKFDGVVLDYPLFKKNWEIEVSPNYCPELVELNSLMSAVPASAKDSIYEGDTLKEGCSILDKIYG